MARPPSEQVTAHLLVRGIGAYQVILSPLLARGGVRCRFRPTCSHYAVEVLERDGTLVGAARTVGRLLRCGPWTPQGTLDLP